MFRAMGGSFASSSRYRVTVVSFPAEVPSAKAGRKVKDAVETPGVGRDWKVSPDRAEASTTAPWVRGWPPTVSTPALGSGRAVRVMEDRSEDRKSSWEKVTDPPARVFLEKSATPAGVFSFFCQKNAEAGVAMDTTSARASRGTSPWGREKCFNAMTSFDGLDMLRIPISCARAVRLYRKKTDRPATKGRSVWDTMCRFSRRTWSVRRKTG